jgi:F-type H+-transporting ATPase subunit b
MEEETIKERAQLLEQARQTAAAIREEALRHATRQIERARRRLQAEAAALAIQLAERQLAEGLTADDQRRLVDDTLRQLGEQP